MTPAIVVKIGGGVLGHPADLDSVLAAVGRLARATPLVVVPGGGPFADAVRAVDARLSLSDDAAHWMAVLAMDQYAHVIAERLPEAALVADRVGIGAALSAARVPVLAPYLWLRQADPLPHSWDVTSDSIAAWIAGEVGARRLLLIKPRGSPADGVDAYFSRALPAGVVSACVPADEIEQYVTSAFRRTSG